MRDGAHARCPSSSSAINLVLSQNQTVRPISNIWYLEISHIATHVHSHMYSTVLCASAARLGTIQFADAFARPCNHGHREVDMQSTQSWWWGTRTYSSRTRSRCTIWPAGARRRIRREIERARQTVKWKSVSSGKRLARRGQEQTKGAHICYLLHPKV